jgi:hypothetical protein
MRPSTPQFQRLGNFYAILDFEAKLGPFVSVSSFPEQLETYLLLDLVATLEDCRSGTTPITLSYSTHEAGQLSRTDLNFGGVA